MKWQLIATAPKNGRKVLLWHGDAEIVMSGWWSQPLNGWNVCHSYHGNGWTMWAEHPRPSEISPEDHATASKSA